MSNLTNKNKIEIIIHLLVWLVLFYTPVALTYGTDSNWKDIAIHFWLQFLFLAVIFYLNYLWLIEDILFGKKRRLLYVLINISIAILLMWAKFSISHALTERPADRPKGPPLRLIWYMDFFVYLIPVAFAIAIRSGKRLIGMDVYRAEVENIKLQAELQHLKFQLQPHFFFNSLNNIYSLIETEPDKARQSIHSMSKLMRHLLQASDASTITLAEEIDFLEKYIALMKVRLSDKTEVIADFPHNVPPVHIAPLLFISLVENAFKHGVSATQASRLEFSMSTTPDKVVFTSRNRLFVKPKNDLSGSGIGLVNLRKRLSLLYPGKYDLLVHQTEHDFEVTLRIDLT